MIVRENISFERGDDPRKTMRIGKWGRFKGMNQYEVADGIVKTVQNSHEIKGILEEGEKLLRKSDFEDWDEYVDNWDVGYDPIPAIDDKLRQIEDQIDELVEGNYPIIKGKEQNVKNRLFDMVVQGLSEEATMYSIADWIDESYLMESVNFERGLDPRETMNIGDEEYRILQKMKTIATSLGIPEIPIDDLNNRVALASWRMPGIEGSDQERRDTGIGRIILFKREADDEVRMYSKGIRGSDIDQWYTWDSPRKWIENIKMINEDVNFERGKDPKRAMRVGDPVTVMEILLRELASDPDLYIYAINPAKGHGFITISTMRKPDGKQVLRREIIEKFSQLGLDKYFRYSSTDQQDGEKYFYFDILPEYEEFISYPEPGEELLAEPIINESISFERGKDPRATMDIGASKYLKDDVLGNQSGWTLTEKERPSKLLGLDPYHVYILGFAGEYDYSKWEFNDFTGKLESLCEEGEVLDRLSTSNDVYLLIQTDEGKIVRCVLDTEGIYYYGDIETALNLDLPNVPQEKRESLP